ncbi:hypothetical protein [Streptomyces sp. SCL15-4]|nr:hypothetical protein [Streptomyces sp. SCL15-4]
MSSQVRPPSYGTRTAGDRDSAARQPCSWTRWAAREDMLDAFLRLAR